MPGSSELEDGVLVTEYYEMPSAEFNKGRLLITCGDILLYEGDLPYKIGEGNERGIPFIRQVSNFPARLLLGNFYHRTLYSHSEGI